MAKGYNLTVQINLQGPGNLNSVVNNINKKLSNIQANVNVNMPANVMGQLNQLNRNMKGVQQSANAAASTMENFGKSAGLAIKRFAAFTTATAGFYAVARATQQSLEKFIEYDRQLVRIAQVTGATRDSLGGLSNEITRLSVSLGTSSSELARVAVVLSQAGLSAKETETALKSLALTTLGASFDDINQTVEGSIALMRQFSISTSQLESALGSINAVAAQFAVEASDIITAIQRTGGVFAAASTGVSQGTDALNEFIAVFTSVRATTRESAETIATGLRTIFTRIQREDTIAALREFGISLTDLEGKFVGPYKAIELLSQGLRSLDPRDISFSNIIEELGGFRQVGKVIPLIQQFSTAQQALNVAQQGSGSLARDAAVGQQALAVQIAKVQEEFNALIRSIGETTEFKQFIRLSLDLASALIQVADAVKPVIPALAALGAVGIARSIGPFARGFRGAIGLNSGGVVPGSGNSDTVPAMLTPGEFVIRKKAVQSLGASRLHKMNKFGAGGVADMPHFAHLDEGPNVYKDKKLYGKGLSGIGIKLPGSWNLAWSSNTGEVSGKQLIEQIQKQNVGELFGRLLGGKNDAGRAGSLVGGRDNPVYSKLLDADAKILENMKQAILKNIDPNKIYRSNADLYPLGQAMYSSAPKELQRELVKVRKVQGISGGQLETGRYATINTGDKTPNYSFRQNRGSLFSKVLKYRRANRGGPIGFAAGGSASDTIPAMLTPGEFVINSKAAKRIGRPTLNRLNHAEKRPRGFNRGGWVGLQAGGSPTPPREGGIGALGTVLLLQGAASAFAATIESSGDRFSNQVSAGAQGVVSGLTTGIVAGQALSSLKEAKGGPLGVGSLLGGIGKFAGPIGLAAGAATALVSGFNGIINASREFEQNLRNEQITSSLGLIGSAFERLEKNASDLGALRDVKSYITSATQNIAQNTELQPKAFVGNLFETISGLLTTRSPEEERKAAERSLILEKRGFNAYLKSADDFERRRMVSDINTGRAVENAAQFKPVADAATRLFEERIRSGVSVQNIAQSSEFDKFAEAIARSNPEIEKQILNIRARGAADADEQIKKIQRDAALAKLNELNAIRQGELAVEASQKVGIVLERSLNRIFTTIEQSFNAVADSIQNKFNNLDVSLQGLSGNFKPSLNKPTSLTALQNPTAFSRNVVKSAIQSIKPLFGSQQDTIAGLAEAGFNIEEDVAKALNTVLSKSTAGTTEQDIQNRLQASVREIVGRYGLQGQDIDKIIQGQVTSALAGLTKEGDDTKRAVAIQQFIDGLLQNIPALNRSKDLIIKATESFVGTQQAYNDKLNQIASIRVQQEQYLIKASSILADSVLSLNEALGKPVSLREISQNFFNDISKLTGGATTPQDIFNNLQNLGQRQASLIARRDALVGKPDETSIREFQRLSAELIDVNVAITNNKTALDQLANSSLIASEALGRIREAQQRRQEQGRFLEKLVTTGPEEALALQQTFAALNTAAKGQALTVNNSTVAQKAFVDALRSGSNVFEAQMAARGALAQQRGDVLNLARELAPFMTDQKGRDLQASLLEQFLKDTGNLTPQFKEIVDAIRNPAEDPTVKPLIDVYRQAKTLQANANQALGSLVQTDNELVKVNNILINAINTLSANITKVSAQDVASGVNPINANNNAQPVPISIKPDPVPTRRPAPDWIVNPVGRSNGGVVYASKGKYIGMTPKGTDNIPAMLTEGEFVVNREATRKNLPLLQAINGKKTAYASKGGMIYAADGGQISAPWFMNIDPEEWFNQQVMMLQQQVGMGVERVVPLQAVANLRMRAEWIAAQREMYFAQQDMAAQQQLMMSEMARDMLMAAQMPQVNFMQPAGGGGPLIENRRNLVSPLIVPGQNGQQPRLMTQPEIMDFIKNNPGQAQRILYGLQRLNFIEDAQLQQGRAAIADKQARQDSVQRFIKRDRGQQPDRITQRLKQSRTEKQQQQLLDDYNQSRKNNPSLKARDYAYDNNLTQEEEDFLFRATTGIGLTDSDTIAQKYYKDKKAQEIADKVTSRMTAPRTPDAATTNARTRAQRQAEAEDYRRTQMAQAQGFESYEQMIEAQPQIDQDIRSARDAQLQQEFDDIRVRARANRQDEERRQRAAKYGLPQNATTEQINEARAAERAAFRQKQEWVAEWRSIVAKRKSGQTVYWTETSFNNPEAVGYIRSLGFQFADELDQYLPATNVIGDVGGRIPSTQDLSAMSEMANRTGNSIGAQAIPTANIAYPGLDEQQLGRFLSGVRTARNRPRSSLPTSAVTSNYGDGYSITSYPDGTVKVNVPSATEVAERTRGVWFDANGNRVNPGEAQITGPGGRVDPSKGTFVDKPLYERAMLATDLASTFGGVAGVSPAGRTRYQPNIPTKPTLPPGTRLVRNTVVPGTNVTTPTIEVGANYPPGSISTSVIGGGRPQISSQTAIGPRTKVIRPPKPATQIDYNALRSSGLSHDEAMMYLPKTAPGAERGFKNTYQEAEIGSALAGPIGLTPVSKPTVTTVRPTATQTKPLPTNIDPSKLSDKAKKSLTDQGYKIPTQLERDLAQAQREREQAVKPATLQVLPNETPQEAAKRVAEIKALKPGSTTDPAWKRRGLKVAQPISPKPQTATPSLPKPVPLTPKPTTRQQTKPISRSQSQQGNQPITVRGFSAKEAADTLQARMQQIRDTLASYASTPEKAKELKANQGLFPVKQLNVSDKPTYDFYDPKAGKTVRAPVRGLYNANTEAMSIASEAMQKAASGGAANILTHELAHSFQKSSLGMKKAADVPKSISGADVDLAKFLEKGGQYEQLRDKVISSMGGNPMDSGMYTANQIIKKPIELMTSMTAAAVNQPEIFKEFPAAQAIMKKLMMAHGYENGGVVTPKYLSTGGQLVNYEPRGTDTIPAMLSKGEFVVNREATKKNLGLLKAINKSSGGMVKNGVLYARYGTNDAIGSLSSSLSDGGMDISGNIQIDMPTPTLPNITASSDPAVATSIQTFNTAVQNFVSQGISPFVLAATSFANNNIQKEISAAPEIQNTPAEIPIFNNFELPTIDFSQFTQGISNFQASSTIFTSSIQTLAGLNFGVIKTGADTFASSVGALNAPVTTFNNAVGNFVNQTNTLIAAINNMGNINGSISVGGTISVQPLTVNIAGLESIDARINGMGSEIIRAVATLLSQDNPGFNVSSLQASINQ